MQAWLKVYSKMIVAEQIWLHGAWFLLALALTLVHEDGRQEGCQVLATRTC